MDLAGRKVAEEATEVLLAAKNDEAAEAAGSDRAATHGALAGEAGDLLYHALVLLAERGMEPSAVIDVLPPGATDRRVLGRCCESIHDAGLKPLRLRSAERSALAHTRTTDRFRFPTRTSYHCPAIASGMAAAASVTRSPLTVIAPPVDQPPCLAARRSQAGLGQQHHHPSCDDVHADRRSARRGVHAARGAPDPRSAPSGRAPRTRPRHRRRRPLRGRARSRQMPGGAGPPSPPGEPRSPRRAPRSPPGPRA